MGTKRNLSITDDKYRFNDDFVLNCKANQYIDTDFVGGNVFSSVNDWSISFFHERPTEVTSVIWDNRGGLGSVPEGIELLFDKDVDDYTFRFRTGRAVVVNDYFFSDFKYKENQYYHTVLNYVSSTNELILFVNSCEKQRISLLAGDNIDCSNVVYSRFFAFSGSTALPYLGSIRDFAVFDKKLSEAEINYIYETGVLPNSSHVNCQFHMPFNHIPKVIGLDRVMLDVVSNYDYTKGSPVTPNNGVMNGWTDDELGISNPSRNSAFNGFYSNSRYYGTGLSFDDNANSEFNYRGQTPNLNTINWANGYTIVIKCIPDNVGSNRGDIFYMDNTGTGEVNYFFMNNLGTFTLRHVAKSAGGSGGAEAIQDSSPRLAPTIYVITFSSASELLFYKNGILTPNNSNGSGYLYTPPNTTGLLGSQGNSRKTKAIYYVGVYNSILNAQQIEEYSKTEDWLSLNPQFFYGSENDGSSYIDQSGNLGNATIQNPTYFQNNQRYVDESGFQPRLKGLEFNGSSQYLEIPNMTQFDVNEGITVICSLRDIITPDTTERNFLIMDDTNFNRLVRLNYEDLLGSIGFSSGDTGFVNLSVIVDKSQTNFSVYRINNNNANDNGNYYDGRRSRVGQINCGDSVRGDSALGRTDATYSTFIGGRPVGGGASFLDCKIEYVAIFKGILNDAEVKSLYNNGLFRNPNVTIQETYDLELFIDFNNPFDDGTLKFPDLSPNNHTIIANGWTSLVDLQNSLFDL